MMRYLFLFLTLQIPFLGFTQDIINISKQDLLAKVNTQNLANKLAKQEVNGAKAELLQTRAMYLPNVTASYTGMTTNNPLMAFGSKLNQSRVSAMDFNPDLLNDPKNIFNFATKLEVLQPIINKDAEYMKKAGEVKVDALQIKAERTQEYMQLELNKAYMQLQMAYKVVDVLESAKKTTLANQKLIEDYFKNNLVQKSEVLYINVRIAEIDNQLQFAKTNIRNASDYIYFLLDEDAKNKVLKPNEALVLQNNSVATEPELNGNRKDFQAYNKSLEAYDWMLKSSKAKSLPRLNAFGSYELHNRQPYQFKAGGYMLGVQASWNIFDGFKANSEQEKYKADLLKAQMEINQYTKQSALELNKVYRQLRDAENKIALSKLALEQSKEAYRIRENRYGQGLEKSADLLSAETLMSQKELEYHQAVFEYNTTLEYLKFLN